MASRILPTLLATLASTSCLDAPVPYSKERGALTHAPAQTILVATVERADGSVSAKVEPSAAVVQVVKASASSAIAGAAVTFPPGSILVATDITIGLGATLVPDAEDAELTAKLPVVSAAPSVVVASTVALSAGSEFEVTLPLPQQAALTAAEGSDTNLVVIYKVKKGDETVIGIYLRDQLQLRDGFAVIATRFFGTFQAVRLKGVLNEQREVVAAPAKALATPARRFHASGFVTTTFRSDTMRADGLSGAAQSFLPSRVGIGSLSLQSGLRSSKSGGE